MSPLTLAILALVAQQYPAAKQGGQYMHNYYIPPAPGTTPWAPAWSPDGRSIAVSMQGSIWKVDPLTGAAAELVAGPKYYSSPDWSPDGKWIVYTADDDARSVQLEILDVETGATRALTSDSQIYLDPTFSPDGSRLAFVTSKPAGNFNISIRAIRGGDWTGPEIAITTDNRYPRDRLYFSAWDISIQPAWTRDGKELLFVTNRGVALGSGDLYKGPAEPGMIEKASRVLAEQTLYRTRPHVSPDGKRIVYSSTSGSADQFSNLYVLPTTGGQPYKLTFGDYDHFHPRWSPDGESIAYISNEGGLPQLWILETYGGKRRKVAITERRWKRPMGKLQVTVLDETGRKSPARIHGLASDGKFYAPTDAYSRLGAESSHTFHTAGEYSVEVPAGKMTVEALRGFEYEPVSGAAEIRPGATTSITLRLKRSANMAMRGWYSASTHVHMNYGGNLHNTPENLLHMSRAEGTDLIMNLVANKDNRILDHQYFGHDTREIHFGEEYRPPFYGHTFFIGLRDHLISPFTTGYEGTGIESLYPSNTDMFRKAKAQGAVTGYVHAFRADADPLDTQLGVGKGFPVDAALTAVDCLEWSGASRASLGVWHHALNNDLRVTPTGGEDSISSLHRTKLVGSVRTYAHTGGSVSISSWIDALRKGRTFFSTGPLLDLKINGKLPGEDLRLPPKGGDITVTGFVHSIAPLSKVVLYRNGKEESQISGNNGPFTLTAKVTESSWFSLYAEGPSYRYFDAEYPQASTSAIRVYVGDGKIRNKESAEYFVRWIAKLKTMADAWPWWRSEKERAHVFAQFDEATAVYRRLATEATR